MTQMSVEDAQSRLAKARTAQGRWAQLSPEERARALRPLRHLISERMDEVLGILSGELGKPPMDALGGDVMVTLEQLRYYERRAASMLRPKKVSRSRIFFSGTSFQEILEPHGVVLICAPWNYPLQLSVVPMATALYAGNAVLLKCSERTPRTAQFIAEVCTAAGLPEGLVQVSWEMPEVATALLSAGPDFVFFTGSNRNGRLVNSQAAEQMIPAVMELGGKDAALVFDSCDLQRTVDGIAYGSFANSGQVCVGTKRIYVQQTIYNEFLRRFVERVAQLRTGTSVESDLGQVRFEAVARRLREQIEDALDRGAKLHTPPPGESQMVTPTVLTDVPAEAPLLLEESFGPVVCVAPFEAEADAVALANSSSFALSASVWTRDKAQAQRVAKRLKSGSCTINDAIRSVGNPHASFGGNQSSGFGRYHGAEGLRTFSRIKTIMTSTHPSANEIHWFPFKTRTFKQVRALLQFRHGRALRSRIKALTGLWMLLPIVVCGVCSADSTVRESGQGDISVDVTLPTHAHGEIAYLVFSNPDGFPDTRDKALRHNFVPVDPEAARQHIDLGAFPPGRYAISLYLDENGNHKLDKNLLGMPKEAVGVSENPRKRLGAPHFDDAAFTHGTQSESIPITLVYCCKQ
jgi:acyl-CoA reductase-like NAD-dependent aldehyde dehydrogenase/uncharacterized protein (DUF2141 family)